MVFHSYTVKKDIVGDISDEFILVNDFVANHEVTQHYDMMGGRGGAKKYVFKYEFKAESCNEPAVIVEAFNPREGIVKLVSDLMRRYERITDKLLDNGMSYMPCFEELHKFINPKE